MARKTRRRASKRRSTRKQRGGLHGHTNWSGNPVNYDPNAAQRYTERYGNLKPEVPSTKVAPERPIENFTDEQYKTNMALIHGDDPNKPSRNILHRMMAAIASGTLASPLQTVERYVNENRNSIKNLVNGKTVGKWFGGGHTPLDILEKHCKPPTCSFALKYHIRKALEPFIIVKQ